MVWNHSVEYNELELIAWVLREAKIGVCVPLERLLACIGVKYGWPSADEGLMVMMP